jgi:sulfite exporter TauE/SafE
LTWRTRSSHDFVSNSKFWFFKIFQNSRTSSYFCLGKKIGVKELLDSAIENFKELSVCLKGLVVLWAGNLTSLTTTDSGSLNIMKSENRQLLILKKIKIKEPLVLVTSKTSKTL